MFLVFSLDVGRATPAKIFLILASAQASALLACAIVFYQVPFHDGCQVLSWPEKFCDFDYKEFVKYGKFGLG